MSKTLVKFETFNNTPIGNFPLDWDIVAIGDIATFVGSGITPKGGSNVYKKEGILFIRSQNVTFEGLLLDDVAHIDERIHKIMKRSEVFAHDVLLNITGASIGRCCPLPEGLGTANVNQHVCAIRLPNPNRENAIFLSSVLASYIGESQINKLNAGGNREGLNYQQLRAFLIPFPPTQERADIAKILDAIDKAIALTDIHITKLKKAKAGLLHDLLTRGIDEHGELRDYTRNPELFKRSVLGIIPKDWETPTIDEVTVDDSPICYGIVQTGSYVESGIPVLAIYNMGRDYRTNIHKASQLIENRYIRSRVKPNDVLISVKGTIGRVDIVPNYFFGNISRDIARIRLKSYILPKYVFQTLSSQILQLQIRRTAVGTTRAEISIWILKQLRLPLPQIEEQERIVNYLDTHNFRISSQETRLEKLKLLKKGLMSDLLTGRVRVKI